MTKFQIGLITVFAAVTSEREGTVTMRANGTVLLLLYAWLGELSKDERTVRRACLCDCT